MPATQRLKPNSQFFMRQEYDALSDRRCIYRERRLTFGLCPENGQPLWPRLRSDTLQISHQQVEAARALLALVHHQIKATRQMWQLGWRSHQRSGLEQIGDHAARQAGDAEPAGHRTLDGFRVAELDARPQTVQVGDQQLVDDLVRARPWLAQ